MKSKYLGLNARDFWRGLGIAVLTALLTNLYNVFVTGVFPVTWIQWQPILAYTASTLVSYLLANIFTNSQGKVFTKEKARRPL
jgi:hypothetical protein